MKIDFQIDNNEDMEYFKTLFSRSFGTDQILYYCHLDNITVRIQSSFNGESQLVTMGMFYVIKEGKTTSSSQFCPLSDSRFEKSEVIQRIWGQNTKQPWGTFEYKEDAVDLAFENIRELLYTVYKTKN